MVDLAGARVLAILTRAPSAGGKSRLFASLGIPADRALLEALLLDTVDAAAVPGVRIVVAVTPPEACDDVRRALRDSAAGGAADVIAQADGDLGERMRSTMAWLVARGAAAVALIGSDLPDIPAASLARAFDALEAEPDAVVLGPAVDGGYYLVAGTRVPELFTGIEWGTSAVLEQTVAAADARGIRIRLLPLHGDVDTADDVRRVAASGRAPRVAGWIADIQK